MAVDNVRRLDEIDLVWDIAEYRWEQGFDRLCAYKNEFGNCLVPREAKYGNYSLGQWVRITATYK